MRLSRVLWVLVLGCVAAAVIFVAVPGVVGRLARAAGHYSTTTGETVITDKSTSWVSLKVGDVLQVRLGTNGGYDWMVAPVVNPTLVMQGVGWSELHPVGSERQVGDVEVFKFRAVNAGKQDLQFEFCGPWDKGTSVAKKVVFL
jgi:hypothetical protein